MPTPGDDGGRRWLDRFEALGLPVDWSVLWVGSRPLPNVNFLFAPLGRLAVLDWARDRLAETDDPRVLILAVAETDDREAVDDALRPLAECCPDHPHRAERQWLLIRFLQFLDEELASLLGEGDTLPDINDVGGWVKALEFVVDNLPAPERDIVLALETGPTDRDTIEAYRRWALEQVKALRP